MATRCGAGVIGSPTLTSTWKVTSARAREQARVTRTPEYCSSSLMTSARAPLGVKTSPSSTWIVAILRISARTDSTSR
jgi:hypothetical protein